MKYGELYPGCHPNLKDDVVDASKHCNPCPQLPGTVLRIFIPAGAVVNLLNLIEIASPSGVCLIIRLPFLAGLLDGNSKCRSNNGVDWGSMINAVRTAGGTVEIANQ